MPENNNKRNAHPGYGQKGATEALATPAREAVCSLNAMLDAEDRAHRHVGYKNSVSRFHMLKMSKCNQLCNELINGTYQPQKGEKHEVFEPKYRIVMSSKYRDRVVQSSFITNYYYGAVIPKLITNNCACIKGRGVDMARDALKDILAEASMDDCCLKADMTNYFGSIIHENLYGELSECIVDDWAKAFFIQTCENASSPVGLDLGSEVYQLSGTAFPNRLDHILDNGNYIRYQDDMIFVGSREECIEALRIIREESARLGLTVSEKKTYIQPVKNPIKFLGFSFLKHKSGRVTMKRLPDKIRKEKRKLKRMKEKNVPIERVEAHYQSVRECLKKGTRSDLAKMDKYVNELFYGGKKNDYSSQR